MGRGRSGGRNAAGGGGGPGSSRPMKVTNLSSSSPSEQQQQQGGYDIHHNNDSSCCRILHDVARQIIPLCLPSNNSDNDDEEHQQHENNDDAEKIILPPLLAKMLQEHLLKDHEAIIIAASSLSALSDKGNNSSSKKKKKKKKKKKSLTTEHQQQQDASSLSEQTDAIIITIPLEEQQQQQQGNDDTNNNISDENANHTTTTTTITAIAATSATTTTTTTTANTPTVVTPNDKKTKSKQQQHQQQDPNPSSGDEMLMLQPSLSAAATIEAMATPAAPPSPLKRMNPWLEDFLTTFRQSMDENEQQQQQPAVPTPPPPPTDPPTRNLQDFLDFLSRTSSSCAAAADALSQQQPKNTKSSSSSSSHVTLHQVQDAMRQVDCPRCTLVFQRYFQHATKIPLLSSLNAIYEKQERLLHGSSSNNNYDSSLSRRRRPQYYNNSEPQSLHYQHLHNVNTSSPASLFGLDDDADDNNDNNNNSNHHYRNFHNPISSSSMGRSRSDSSDNDHHAFDYVAMEEGILQHESQQDADDPNNLSSSSTITTTTPCLAFVKVSTDQKKISSWQLRRMDHDNNVGSSSSGQYYSSTPMTNWTMNDLNFLLQEYMLVGGLGHDEMVGATSACCDRRLLSDEQFIDIVENVQVRYSKVLGDLTQCINEILRHEMTLKELTASSNGGGGGGFGDITGGGGGGGAIVGNIDMTGPTTMMDIDSNVCSVLGRLLQIVLDVTESYQTIGLYLNRTSTCSNKNKLPRHVPHLLTNDWVIMSMWQVYLQAFGDILANTLTFEQKLFSIADRHGKINPFFYSGTARQFLYELVQKKVGIVVMAVDSIKHHLDDRLDIVETTVATYRPTFMRSLFTYEAFLSMIGQTNKERAKSPLDQACADVLLDMREWSETVQESSITNILDKHRARRDRLFRLLRIAQKQFQTDMEVVKSSSTNDTRIPGDQALQSMGQPLTALLEKYSETLSDSSSDDQGDRNSQETLTALRGQLPSAILSSIQLWLSLSVNPAGQNEGQAKASSTTTTTTTAAMPLRLVQFLTARAKDECDPSRCPGPDGTIRAVLAMTALFCRWLSDRFNEWHAELVQQELLTAMEDEQQQPAQTSTVSSTTNTKSAKKSKKKKAKTSLAAVSSSSLSEDVASKDQSLGSGGGNDTRSTNGSKTDLASAGGVTTDVHGKSKAVVVPVNGDAARAAAAADASDIHEKQEGEIDPETTDAIHSSLPPQQPDVDVSHLDSKTSITIPTDNSNCNSNKGGLDAAKEQPNGHAPSREEGNSYSESAVVLMDVDPFVQIGVDDRNSFISAESFLVGRFLKVTTSGDEGQRNVTIL